YFSCGEPLGFVGEISKYYPSDLVALHHKLQSIKFGNGVLLGIWYANLTDVEFNPTLEAKYLLVDEQVINYVCTYQLKSLPYSTDVPLGFHYYNITDVDQTETWHFLAVVKHRQVITF